MPGTGERRRGCQLPPFFPRRSNPVMAENVASNARLAGSGTEEGWVGSVAVSANYQYEMSSFSVPAPELPVNPTYAVLPPSSPPMLIA